MISCTDSTVELKFDDPKYAAMAYKAWKDVKEWVALFDYTSCAEMLTTLKVTKVDYDGGNVISIPNNEIAPEKVLQDFEFQITSHENKTQQDSWIKGDTKGNNVAFNLNYDPDTNATVQPLIQLLETKSGYVGCSDCFASGRLNYGAVFKGKGKQIESFKFFATGEVKANLDLQMESYKGGSGMSIGKSLVALTFGAIGSPGLFTLSSSVNLEAGINVNAPEEKVIATVGFDATIPFSMDISSNNSLKSFPTQTGSFKPALNFHEFVSNEAKVNVEAILTPSIDFGFHMLGLQLGWVLALENVVGSTVGFGNPKCPSSYTLGMYQQSKAILTTNVLTKQYYTELASSPRIEIECSRCNKCPLQRRNQLRKKRSF